MIFPVTVSQLSAWNRKGIIEGRANIIFSNLKKCLQLHGKLTAMVRQEHLNCSRKTVIISDQLLKNSMAVDIQ